MKKHLFAGLVAVLAGVTVMACSDVPSAPAARPDVVASLAKGGNGNGPKNGTVGSSDTPTDSVVAYLSTLHDTVSRTIQPVVGVQRQLAITTVQTASATIGSEGGMVQLPTAGAYLWVPPRAVSAPTTFSISAKPGKAVSYDFQPAGSVFSIPVVLIQDRTVLSTNAPTGFNSVALGYFGNDADLDLSTANGLASQIRFPLSFSTDQYAAFPIWHFSGYIVSWAIRDAN